MTPLELWKSFIDSFAKLHDGVHTNWIVERSSYPDVEENAEVNAFLAGLSKVQRELLARMLVDARRGGVHDALVVLNDRMAIDDGHYFENGVEMEFQPFGSELYYDYVCRQAGEDWPDPVAQPNNPADA